MIGSVLPGIQGDCKVTAERMTWSKDKHKIKAEMTNFSPFFFFIN
jgi:hypothetical protein